MFFLPAFKRTSQYQETHGRAIGAPVASVILLGIGAGL
jgi:hypothetical protein